MWSELPAQPPATTTTTMNPLTEFFASQWEGISFELEPDHAVPHSSYQTTQAPPRSPLNPPSLRRGCRWESSPKRANMTKSQKCNPNSDMTSTTAPRLPRRKIAEDALPQCPPPPLSRSHNDDVTCSSAPRFPQRTSSLPKTARDHPTVPTARGAAEPACQRVPAARMA